MNIEKQCMVCGNKKDFKLRWKAKKHHPAYYTCKSCGLVFSYPQEYMKFEDVPVIPITESEYNSRIKNYAFRYKKIEEHLPTLKPDVLDIGCQNGVFLSYMKSNGCDVLGIEPSSAYSKFAIDNYNINVINGFFENQEIDQKFDLITMFNVIEHTKNPRETLIKAFRLLNRDGLIVLEVPNIFTPQSTLSLGFWHHFEIDHNWFFNKNTISELLQQTGFEVLSVTSIPKIACLSKILDGLLTSTLYMHISRDSYLKFRKSAFYQFLNKHEVKIDIKDYIYVVAKKI